MTYLGTPRIDSRVPYAIGRKILASFGRPPARGANEGGGRIEKAAGSMTSDLPGSKLLSSKMAPCAPVFVDLHWRAKGANQNCCSIKGTKTLLRLGHTLRLLIPRQLPLSPIRIFARRIETPFDVPLDRPLDTHFREQHWSAVFGGVDKHLNRKPPSGFRRLISVQKKRRLQPSLTAVGRATGLPRRLQF